MGETAEQTAATAVPDSEAGTVDARNSGAAAGGKTAAALKDDLRFELVRNGFYHEDRESWFGWLDRLVVGVVLLLGSAAIAAFGAEQPEYGQVAGAVIAALSIVSLVWNFGGQARIHTALKQRYYFMLAGLEAGDNEARVRADMARAFADEPPSNAAVNARAHNMAGKSVFGDDFTREPISTFRLRLRHIVG